MKRVSYQDVQTLTLRLARILEETVPEFLETADFVAIPRGGHIVLGLLSYSLRLSPEQMRGEGSGPLVLVDDCLLSGSRTQRLLPSLPGRQIILAHLFSVPEARRALLSREPRVTHCLAAADLSLLRQLDPVEEAAWARRVKQEGYWWGFAEDVQFPWSEPDRVFWNARESRVEPGWHKVPPHSCLKHLANLEQPIWDWPAGDIRLREGVHWRFEGEAVSLWDPESDQVFRLEDVSAAMFRACLAWGSRGGALGYLLRLFDAEPAEIESDLDQFLEQMRRRRLFAAANP